MFIKFLSNFANFKLINIYIITSQKCGWAHLLTLQQWTWSLGYMLKGPFQQYVNWGQSIIKHLISIKYHLISQNTFVECLLCARLIEQVISALQKFMVFRQWSVFPSSTVWDHAFFLHRSIFHSYKSFHRCFENYLIKWNFAVLFSCKESAILD